MRAFRRVPEGLACGLDDWERELLARLALEVRALLQADAPQGVGQSETSSPSPPDPVARARTPLSLSCSRRPRRIPSPRWRSAA